MSDQTQAELAAQLHDEMDPRRQLEAQYQARIAELELEKQAGIALARALASGEVRHSEVEDQWVILLDPSTLSKTQGVITAARALLALAAEKGQSGQ